jgi:uncharacterized protein YlxP (DUF503 family)
MSSDVHVGVLRLTITVPGSRTLKDRRRVLRSLRDRVRARFAVTFHEVGTAGHPSHQVVVMTTAGNDGGVVRQCLNNVRHFLERAPDSYISAVDLDVFGWHADAGYYDEHERDEHG